MFPSHDRGGWDKVIEKLASIYIAASLDFYADILTPQVAIIIPIYNKPVEFLHRAIKSCTDQTFNDIKIIVVNDGSDIDYQEEIDSWDANIKLINQDNQGVAIARNNGILSSSSEYNYSKYVCCLDADDWIEPTFLETCVNALEQDRTLHIAYTGLMQHRPNGDTFPSPWPSTCDRDWETYFE